ncbi:MAG: lamin tail domain-containing protein [Pirellulaceae bacterium]
MMFFKRRKVRSIRHFESLEDRCLLSGDPLANGAAVIISEVVADNLSSFQTRLRSSPFVPFAGDTIAADWIELRNVSAANVDLGGMHLTDDADWPDQWTFPPSTFLAAGESMILWVSGEDNLDPNLDEHGYFHTNFSLDETGEYLALVDPSGAVIHDFSPLPPLRTNVSHAVRMTPISYLDDSQIQFAVPTDNRWDATWNQTDFDATDFASALPGPIGFDQSGASDEPAETVRRFDCSQFS